MKRKVLVVVLSLALLAGGVGLGIHLLHKEALAGVTYSVTIMVIIDEVNFEPLEGATVHMRFFESGGWSEWYPTTYIGEGLYQYTHTCPTYLDWQVWIEEPEVDPEVPDENPCDGDPALWFRWEVWLEE